MENECKLVKKEARILSIEVHKTESALELNYRLSISLRYCNEIFSEERDLKRLIYFPNLNQKSNCYALAQETIEKCSILFPAHVSQLQELIFVLKNRKSCNGLSGSARLTLTTQHETDTASDQKAYFNKIPEYIEMFYEDLNSKVKGSSLILQIAKDYDNLLELSKNGTLNKTLNCIIEFLKEALLSVLARVLRECWKKSIALSTNIVYVFFCFSNYIDFHQIIIKYKIGSQCMEILSFEIQRYEKLKKDLELLVSQQNRSPKRSYSQHEIAVNKCRIPQLIRPKSGNWSEASSISFDNFPPTPSTSSSSSSIVTNVIDTDDDKIKRVKQSIKKQEQLLRVTVYLLLNLADNRKIEAKMTNKNIMMKLLSLLNRDNDDLVILLITFLKKLSVVSENIDRMKDAKILDKLLPFLTHFNPEIIHLTIRLLFNLSFDQQFLKEMIRLNMFSLFLDLFNCEKHQPVIIKILYHLSSNDSAKELFATTNSVILIIDIILLSRENAIDRTLLALAVNLSLLELNAQKMIENDRLPTLIKKAFRSKDEFLLKLLVNISNHDTLKKRFVNYVGDFAKVLSIETTNKEFLLHCVIIFGNICIPQLDYWQIIEEFKLVDFFESYLKVTDNNDNVLIVYELIILLGILLRDESCALNFCQLSVLDKLIALLKFHQEDDKMVLQILRVFYYVICHKDTQHYVIKNTEIIAYFIDLLTDNDERIKEISRISLNKIRSCSVEWEPRIQYELFRSHNSEWIDVIHALETNSNLSDSVQLALAKDFSSDQYSGDDLPPYMNMKFLRFSILSDLIDDDDVSDFEFTATNT